MSDLLLGLAHIVKHSNFQLPSTRGVDGSNSAPLGKPFEVYCKDWLSLLPPGNINARQEFYDREFIYQGAANNPPDVMFRGGDKGDAFEFKKTESLSGALLLNSSYPKNFLLRTSPGLLDDCKGCEHWLKRSFYYVIGRLKEKDMRVSSLWVVDGRFIAADQEVYSNVFAGLQNAVDTFVHEKELRKISSVELGRVRKIDPLDKSVLRVRSMWELETPHKTFKDLNGVKFDETKATLHALILKERWNAYPTSSKDAINSLIDREGFSITNVNSMKDPSDPMKNLEGILIRYES